MRFTVDRLDHLVLHCEDVELQAAWYQRVLGMEREDVGEARRIALKFGGQKLTLRPHDEGQGVWRSAGTTAPGTADLCFVAAVRPDDVIGHLHACRVAVEHGPAAREGALGMMVVVTCRDPEENLVAIGSYFDERD